MKKQILALVLALASAGAVKAVPTVVISDYDLNGHFLSFIVNVTDPELPSEHLLVDSLIFSNGFQVHYGIYWGFENLNLVTHQPWFLNFGGLNEFYAVPDDTGVPTAVTYLYLPSMEEVFGVPDTASTAGLFMAGLMGLGIFRAHRRQIS